MKSIKSLLQDTLPDMLPVVPTMDVVVFPNQIVPLLVLDDRIIRGINKALETRSKTGIIACIKKTIDTHQGVIGTKDLFDVGTVASVMRVIKIPDGGIKVLVQGISRAYVHDIIAEEEILKSGYRSRLFMKMIQRTLKLLLKLKILKKSPNKFLHLVMH